MRTTSFILASLSLAAMATGAQAASASLSTSGYIESFDAMGTAGTSAPTGWSVYVGNSGTTNGTWSTTIPGNGSNSVASMTLVTNALTATNAPSGTNNNGFNAAFSSSNTSDRVLATSPTTVTGSALQLSLVNDTGAAFSSLTLSYDTRRFTTVSSSEEMPGYRLFYSLDGSSWTNASALNPTLTQVPNSVGVTTLSNALVDFGALVNPGQTFFLRWVDDNGKPTSPDQIIGLNNVSVRAVAQPVPEPEGLALVGAGLALLALRRRRA